MIHTQVFIYLLSAVLILTVFLAFSTGFPLTLCTSKMSDTSSVVHGSSANKHKVQCTSRGCSKFVRDPSKGKIYVHQVCRDHFVCSFPQNTCTLCSNWSQSDWDKLGSYFGTAATAAETRKAKTAGVSAAASSTSGSPRKCGRKRPSGYETSQEVVVPKRIIKIPVKKLPQSPSGPKARRLNPSEALGASHAGSFAPNPLASSQSAIPGASGLGTQPLGNLIAEAGKPAMSALRDFCRTHLRVRVIPGFSDMQISSELRVFLQPSLIMSALRDFCRTHLRVRLIPGFSGMQISSEFRDFLKPNLRVFRFPNNLLFRGWVPNLGDPTFGLPVQPSPKFMAIP